MKNISRNILNTFTKINFSDVSSDLMQLCIDLELDYKTIDCFDDCSGLNWAIEVRSPLIREKLDKIGYKKFISINEIEFYFNETNSTGIEFLNCSYIKMFDTFNTLESRLNYLYNQSYKQFNLK